MSEPAFITDAFIDGRVTELSSTDRWPSINPSTGEVLAEVVVGNADDVDRAVQSSRRSQPAWAATRPSDRGRILTRIAQALRDEADAFARVESLDTGKPLSLSLGDIEVAARYFEFYAGAADKLHGDVIPIGPQYHAYTTHEPYGVIGVILPWNAPLQQAARSLAPALTTGNAVVVKPAEDAPLSVLLLAQLATRCGVPDGILNVVPGDGPTTGQALVDHTDVRRLMFTGSVEIGRHVGVAGAQRLVPVGLELGGKSPNIVFADADLEAAIAGVARSTFTNTGQVCLCTERVYVERPVYDDVVKGLAEHARGLRLGRPDDPATTMGPLISRDHRAKVAGHITAAIGAGAEPVVGGGVPDLGDGLAAGAWYEPTVLVGADQSSPLMRDEVFGPVCGIVPFDTEDEAIALANDTRYGLAAAVWTRDLQRGHRVAAEMAVGIAWVNTWFLRDLRSPFGGRGLSGIGREGGDYSLHFYSDPTNVCVAL